MFFSKTLSWQRGLQNERSMCTSRKSYVFSRRPCDECVLDFRRQMQAVLCVVPFRTRFICLMANLMRKNCLLLQQNKLRCSVAFPPESIASFGNTFNLTVSHHHHITSLYLGSGLCHIISYQLCSALQYAMIFCSTV